MALLRFVTCGSVDDGKSTLVGRLLHDGGMLPEDQVAALAADSRKHGTQGAALDCALLCDGLAAEREQGITIDVAYRYFSTPRHKYIVADCPGHEEYTRNMVSGASNADAAVILVDARKGVLTQTRRHAFIAALMGIEHLLVAVNKMDLAGYSEERFRAIEEQCKALAARIGHAALAAVPVSALYGENLARPGERMPWYDGPTLLGSLEAIEIDDEHNADRPFRIPVQWVNRSSPDFRGFAGTIASGTVCLGDRVRVHPSGRESTVARIVAMGGDLPRARAGQSITLSLADEIDISRGDMLARAEAPAQIADQFEATIIWLGAEPMLGGRPYLMKIATSTVVATPAAPKYRVDVESFEHIAARKLELNEIGVCNLALERQIPFDPYKDNRETGGFILIDRFSNATVGAGLLHFALRRADNIHPQHVDVDRAARARSKGHRASILWLTGLSGAGKSTIANLLEKRLVAAGRHTYLLDGDNLRHGLNRDLGFTDADRVENVRRVAEVARLMMDAGLIVIVSLISPFRAERRRARELVAPGEFVEIFVDVPLALAEQRDAKGLYRKARRGELKNFTGIDSPYEVPEGPELTIDTAHTSADAAVARILRYLAEKGVVEEISPRGESTT